MHNKKVNTALVFVLALALLLLMQGALTSGGHNSIRVAAPVFAYTHARADRSDDGDCGDDGYARDDIQRGHDIWLPVASDWS